MQKEKLRIGLLLDDRIVSAWTFEMIKNIACSHCAQMSLVVINGNERPLPNKTLSAKLQKNHGRYSYLLLRKILETLYSKLIERRTFLPDANAPRDCAPLVASVPHLTVKTVRGKFSDRFKNEDIAEITQHDIDIFVRCGFGILRGDILSVARYGVWSFHHGDNLVNRGGPAGYWESMENWPETGSILQILTEDLDNGKVLYRSFSCTHTMSVTDNISSYYWKSLSFMTRKMKELHTVGEEEFFRRVDHENRHPLFYSERLYVAPSNRELLRLTCNKLIQKVRLLHENQFYLRQWILMFDLKGHFSSSLWRYRKIIPPKDRFWADPHLIQRDGSYFIFVEEYLYGTAKGHIAVITMDEKGNYTEPVTVLERPYHLSYPFVFEEGGEYYMIPESMDNRSVELYRCVEFPLKWQFVMNLMTGVKALDTTLFRHDGLWWMFTNMIENEGAPSNDELFLFYASDFKTAQWTPHPANPVVSDCKKARPAGKIFLQDGRIYRPSQNCSNCYGYGFNLLEITKLTPEEYAEVLVSEVKPKWDKEVVATHTFNRVGTLHVIDALYRRKA